MDFRQLNYRNFKKMLNQQQFSIQDLIMLAKVTPDNQIVVDILNLRNEEINHRLALDTVNDMTGHSRFLSYARFLTTYVQSEEEALKFIPLALKSDDVYASMKKLIDSYPKHALHYLEACKNLQLTSNCYFWLMRSMIAREGFPEETYELIYPFYSKAEKRVGYIRMPEDRSLTKLKHLPSSVLYAFCLEFPQVLQEDYVVNDLVSHPNLTPEVIELLPEDKRQYAKLASDKEGLFAGINKTLTRVAKNAPMEERLQTEAFKSTEHYQAYVERQNDFELFETSLKASQDLAETLINGLNSDLPIDLTAGLRAVRNKTHKLYEFYETLLTSPFNTQGNRAVTYAKASAEESLEDYEEIIDKLLTLTEKERNSKPRREKFDALKADTETLIQLDKHML